MLFAAVSAAAVIAGAAKMPCAWELIAIDAPTFTMGLYYLRQGWTLYRASESEPCDDRCGWAHAGFGFLIVVFAGLTFGAVAIMNR